MKIVKLSLLWALFVPSNFLAQNSDRTYETLNPSALEQLSGRLCTVLHVAEVTDNYSVPENLE